MLEYLEDAKVNLIIICLKDSFNTEYISTMYNGEIRQEHGQKKGDDLLASVRIIGRYDLLYCLFALLVLKHFIDWCEVMN